MTIETTGGVGRETAMRMVVAAQRAFGSADIEAALDGFTDDVVVRFADLPEICGKAALESFLHARFARQRNYRLTKHLRMVDGDMVGNVWEGDWEDAQTGQKMLGRGIEFWTVRDGKIAVWEATFNVWKDGGGPVTPIV